MVRGELRESPCRGKSERGRRVNFCVVVKEGRLVIPLRTALLLLSVSEVCKGR